MNAAQQPSRFFTPLRYENEDGTLIRLTQPFEFHYFADIISVPKGFVCDAQSMPRILWMIDSPQGLGGKAGVVHDYLYWLNGRPHPKTGKRYSRARADMVYRHALVVAGLNPIRAAIRYYALRAFGWIAWNEHSRRIAREESVRPLLKKI